MAPPRLLLLRQPMRSRQRRRRRRRFWCGAVTSAAVSRAPRLLKPDIRGLSGRNERRYPCEHEGRAQAGRRAGLVFANLMQSGRRPVIAKYRPTEAPAFSRSGYARSAAAGAIRAISSRNRAPPRYAAQTCTCAERRAARALADARVGPWAITRMLSTVAASRSRSAAVAI